GQRHARAVGGCTASGAAAGGTAAGTSDRDRVAGFGAGAVMPEHAAFAAALSRVTACWPLAAAARAFAAAAGPVFLCPSGGKRPIAEHGLLDATTEPGQVEAWWKQTPTANIGLPTGAASGVVVVDIDVHGPVDGYEAFARADWAGLVDGWEFLV